eukprot:3457588-Rhodomonas_salina.1
MAKKCFATALVGPHAISVPRHPRYQYRDTRGLSTEKLAISVPGHAISVPSRRMPARLQYQAQHTGRAGSMASSCSVQGKVVRGVEGEKKGVWTRDLSSLSDLRSHSFAVAAFIIVSCGARRTSASSKAKQGAPQEEHRSWRWERSKRRRKKTCVVKVLEQMRKRVVSGSSSLSASVTCVPSTLLTNTTLISDL